MIPKSMLKQQLYKRLGQFVPVETAKLKNKDSWNFVHKDLKMSGIPTEDRVAHNIVKEFMMKHYFLEAPVAKTLKLIESEKGHEVIEKEMNLYLKSGGSFFVHSRSKSNKEMDLVGISLQCLWGMDKNHEVIYTDTKSWHNAAAEIAMEVNPAEPQLIWRDYFVQHLYNMAQMVLRKNNKSLALYFAMAVLKKEYRSSGFLYSIGHQYQKVMPENDGIVFIQSNFRATDKPTLATLRNCYIMDEVKYADIILEADGKRVFKDLEKLDGIRFLVEDLTKDA